MKEPRICVVGACNIDLISYVPRLPQLGETLHGTRFHMGFGGKGANQAVMAAKLGGRVVMISKLGRDVFGDNTVENFKSLGVDTEHVYFSESAFSGVAPIAVDPEGNNSIIIVTGANDLLTEDELERARPAIRDSHIMVCQLEIPPEITLAAMRIARQEGVQVILNPAPARESIPEELYRLSDIFCPNESETELLTGLPVKSVRQAEDAAASILERGAATVILTLGERGSLLVSQDVVEHVEGRAVRALDTTGAGDAFVGSLAFFIARGKPLVESMHRSNRIAAVSVQASGTQTSFPAESDLPSELFD